MSTLSAATVYRAAISAGFSPADAVIATQIAWAESGFNPTATHKNSNGSTDYGLMQINDRANADVLTNGSWTDPVANMRMAKVIKDRQGWKAWVGYTSGRYKQVKVRGNPFSAGSQDMSFIVPGQADSFAVSGSDKELSSLSIPNPLDGVNKLVGAIMNPGFWTRVGIGWLGAVLVMLGVLFLFLSAKDKVTSAVIKGVS